MLSRKIPLDDTGAAPPLLAPTHGSPGLTHAEPHDELPEPSMDLASTAAKTQAVW